MQNKANLRKRQMSVISYNTKGYENLGVCRPGKNKANQSQLKPKPMSRWVSYVSPVETAPHFGGVRLVPAKAGVPDAKPWSSKSVLPVFCINPLQ